MAESWDPALYGDRFAAVYDDWYPDVAAETAATVDALVRLAGDGGGPVVELGAGTGRLAIPLARRGLHVHALDASGAMAERLAGKAAAAGVVVEVGVADMGALTLPASCYGLAFVTANTLFAVGTLEGQRRCLASVSAALRPGGRFVVEAFVPDPDALAVRDGISVRDIEPGRVVLHAALVDAGEQRMDTALIELREGQPVRLFPVRLRYAAPGELDALAGEVGLVLESRWESWSGGRFSRDSKNHISVYRKG